MSGRSVNRGQFTELPITEDVIQWFNTMGEHCREGNGIVFGLCDGTPINDIEGIVDTIDDDTVNGSIIEVAPRVP